MFDINGWELIVLVVVAIVVLGPERLPEYAARLARAVRQLRALAEGARAQLKEQMGPEFDDINWRQYDPRQYDPRRIVREALMDDPTQVSPDKPTSAPPSPSRVHDPARPTPWDPEAT
ncbi:MAG: Sec-independent protein translocase protein TatB [Dermatophilaceae bacterium]